MELLLNLVWVAISAGALLAWISLSRSSYSQRAGTLRGLMVLVCILALLFPVISITDDLSQTIGLAEGARLQDLLKAPELRGIYHLAAVLPDIIFPFRSESSAIARKPVAETSIPHEVLRTPSVEKRPPPILS
jgi:hypothetical protein